MDLGTIVTLATSLKSVADVAKTLSELKSLPEIQAKTIELQTKVLAAQSVALAAQAEQSALIDENKHLKEEVKQVMVWGEQKKRYKLTMLWAGGLVYALKESFKSVEPPHWLCTKCYEEGRKSILNAKEHVNRWGHICPVCQAEILEVFHNSSPKQAEYVAD